MGNRKVSLICCAADKNYIIFIAIIRRKVLLIWSNMRF